MDFSIIIKLKKLSINIYVQIRSLASIYKNIINLKLKAVIVKKSALKS